MDYTAFQSTLANSLQDVPAVIFPSNLIQKATGEAVREYSRYQPMLRRISTGLAYSAGASGDNSLLVVGGPFPLNAPIKALLPDGSSQTLTFTGLTVPTSNPQWVSGRPRQAALSAVLTTAIPEGTYLMPTTPGFTITAGVDTYLLPTDFVSPDASSFNIAVGAKLSYTRGLGFYDAAYRNASKLSGVGNGARQNFGYGGNGFLVTSNPVVVQNSQPAYRFLDGDPPLLMISPVPTVTKTIDFFYNAAHLISSIPDTDGNLILSYARYFALNAQAAILGAEKDFSEDDVHETGSANANALQKLAQDALTDFRRNLALRPYLISG